MEDTLPSWREGILPPEVEEFALAVAGALRVDVAPVAMSFVVASTAVMAGRAWIRPDRENVTWVTPPALWLALVLSNRAPILEVTLAPVRALEKLAGAGNWSVQNPSKRALEKMLAQEGNLLGVYDDLADLFSLWMKETDTGTRFFFKCAYNAMLINLYTPSPAGGRFHYIPRPILSIIGTIEPSSLMGALHRAKKMRWGNAASLLHRFMVVHVGMDSEETPPSKALTPEVLQRLHGLIRRLYERLHRGGELVLFFSEEAQALWYEREDKVERLRRQLDVVDPWRSLLSKGKDLAARLALVLALLWEEEGPISTSTLMRAFQLVDFLEAHAERVWGPKGKSAPQTA